MAEELTQATLKEIKEYCLRTLDDLDRKLADLKGQVLSLEQRRTVIVRLLEDLSHLDQSGSDARPVPFQSESAQTNEMTQLAINFPKPSQTSKRRNSSSHPILRHVHEILKDYPDGLHYTKVYELLLEKGYKVPGKRPQINLATLMSRDALLKRVGRGVYTLNLEAADEEM